MSKLYKSLIIYPHPHPEIKFLEKISVLKMIFLLPPIVAGINQIARYMALTQKPPGFIYQVTLVIRSSFAGISYFQN
jgi:hypothetical protein